MATTWSLSFAEVERRSLVAADLLRVCAFLHPDAIPEEIITEGATALGPNLHAVASNPLALNQAIGVLLSYSLLKRQPEQHLLSVHRQVQAVLKDGMDASTSHLWAERVVQAVNDALPDEVEYRVFTRYERCLPHAQECARLIEQEQLTSFAARRLLYLTGNYLREHARYGEAEAFYRHSLRLREQVLGPDHSEVAYPLNSLAILYREQGKYAEAEPLCQRALHITEQAYGPDHPEVAVPLNNLADLYSEQGKYAEAELLYKRALSIFEQALGLDHPYAAYPLSGLANLYREQGKYAEAEPLYQRALHIRVQSLGPNHPFTRKVARNYANLLRKMRREAEASELEARFPSS